MGEYAGHGRLWEAREAMGGRGWAPERAAKRTGAAMYGKTLVVPIEKTASNDWV